MQVIRFDSPASVEGWLPVDDRVMGGLSTSQFSFHSEGHAVFSGLVKTDNGGGFASVRHAQLSLGEEGAAGYRLEVCGDGRRYKLNLRMDGDFDGVHYQAAFCPPAGRWVQVLLPIGQFSARLRGQPVPGAPALRLEKVRQMGWMVGDGQLGEFELGIRFIQSLGSMQSAGSRARNLRGPIAGIG